MTKLTVEETNLLSIYKTGSRQGLIVAMNAALPFMDGEMRGFAARTLAKVGAHGRSGSLRSFPFTPLMKHERD